MNALAVTAPKIDWAALSPLLALFGGSVVVLLVGLLGPAWIRRRVVPVLTLLALGTAIGLVIWRWNEPASIISGALRIDDLALLIDLVICVAAVAAVLLSLRAWAAEEAGHGEYYALLLATIGGMAVLASAQNTVALFLGFELLSIPLYVLCATELRREGSLESGLKYLVVGSVGSATLVYGLALIYGATGSTDFNWIAAAIGDAAISGDVLLWTGIALTLVGLAFKASIAPFHQWTPDVYEGAPTPVTAFMAVATKAAAFAILLRLLDVALIDLQEDWAPALAALATLSILIGNVGALGQSSLKRLLAYSAIAQAGYMLAGVVVGSRLGLQAVVFYIAVYALMNLAAFAVVIARERETTLGDDIRALAGIGASRPVLAWSMTIAMLALAGIPGTAGFVGKIYLIDATVDGSYTWLGVMIVVGSMISLGYYLRVIAAVWMTDPATVAPVARPAIAGGAPAPDEPRPPRPADEPAVAGADVPPPAAAGPVAEAAGARQPEVIAVAAICAAASIGFGIFPNPLFDLARDAGASLSGLL